MMKVNECMPEKVKAAYRSEKASISCLRNHHKVVDHIITGEMICLDCKPFYDKKCGRCGSRRYRCSC